MPFLEPSAYSVNVMNEYHILATGFNLRAVDNLNPCPAMVFAHFLPLCSGFAYFGIKSGSSLLPIAADHSIALGNRLSIRGP